MAEGRGVRARPLAARLEADFLALAVAAAARDAGADWAVVVGGYVRDRLLGQESADLDVVVPDRGADVAGRVAAATSGHVVPLARWRQWQVFHRDRRVDVTEADDLLDDVARRDLTVNAIGWRILPATYELIDPLAGLSDLAAARLALCRPDALAADPARIVRAARLAACGFVADARTVAAMRAACGGLVTVPLDRVRREWRRLAAAPRPAAAIALLARTGALAAWLGDDVALQESAIRVRMSADPCAAPRSLAVAVLGPSGLARDRWIDAARRLGCSGAEAASAFAESQGDACRWSTL